MTVTTLNSSTSTVADGTVRTFYFDFHLQEVNTLYVYIITAEGVKSDATNYAVDDGWGDSGGSITFELDEQPADGETVLMQRIIPRTQETDYTAGGPFPAQAHENALDKLTMLGQDGVYVTAQCITVPDGDTATDLELPFATNRANTYLSFDANGNVTVASIPDEVPGVLDLTYGSTVAWNLYSGKVARLTIAGDCTLSNPTGKDIGSTYILIVVQDAVGAHTLSFGSEYLFEDGADPEMAQGASATTIISFVSDGTSMYGGVFWKEE